jgi:hypothetical protein
MVNRRKEEMVVRRSRVIEKTFVAALVMLSTMGAGCKTAECKTTSAVKDCPVTPVTFNNVKLEDDFWLPRLKTQSRVTVPHALKETEPAVERLRLCGNILHGRGGPKPKPHRFISSDLYKVMEGAACLLMIRPDPGLEKKMDEIIDVIADAQKEDGYLYVSHICGNPNPRGMGKTPYSWVVHSHGLYDMGHMYEGPSPITGPRARTSGSSSQRKAPGMPIRYSSRVTRITTRASQ